MKNKVGIAVAGVMMLLVIGLISFLSVGMVKEGGAMVAFSLGGIARLRNTVEIPLSETQELQVLYSSKNLAVYPAEGDTVIIKEYLISDRKEAQAEVNTWTDEVTGRQIATVTGGKTEVITLFGFFGQGERIEVYLPKEGPEVLKLQTKSGNISVREDFSLQTEKLEVTAGSGNIKWQDTRAQELSVSAGSGNVKLKSMAGSMTVKTGSGNITVEQFSGQGTLEAGSGNITMEQFSGQGSMKAGSGNVKVEALEVTGDMKLTTGSGNIRLSLPEKLAFRLEAETTSGNINTSFDEALSYNKKGNQAGGEIGDGSTCLIQTKAKSGNINITVN